MKLTPVFSKLAVVLITFLSSNVWADINFDGYTRFIFESSQKQLTFNVVNEGNEVALVQVTLDWGDKRSSAYMPMAVSRPLLKIPANGKASVDVLYQGTGLPDDQESFLRLSVLEVPKKPTEGNVAQITLQHNLKFFYRPKLPGNPQKAVEELHWTGAIVAGSVQLKAHNNSPYYLTLTEVRLLDRQGLACGAQAEHLMVAPYSTYNLNVPGCGKQATQIAYTFISDGGFGHPHITDVSTH